EDVRPGGPPEAAPEHPQRGRVHGRLQPYGCQDCGKRFSKRSNLKVHQLLHSGEKPHACEACGKRFRDRSHLRNHRVTHSGEKPFWCEECGKTFTRPGSLRKHQRMCVGAGGDVGLWVEMDRDAAGGNEGETNRSDSSWKPDVSDGQEKKDSELINETEEVNPSNDVWTETVCGESFLSVLSLNEHLKVHSGQQPVQPEVSSFTSGLPLENNHKLRHECSTCHKLFEVEAQLKAHHRTHRKCKTYLCGVCGKFLSSNRSLSRHKMTHSGERPHRCQICERGFKLTFATMSALNGHSRVHLEKRPTLCHLCPKSFDRKSDFVAHSKHHGSVYGNASTGSLGYSCKLCGKTFALETSLKTHEKTHATSDCPFTCQICHKTFQTYQNLMNHRKTHGTVGSFVCSLCNMSFLSEDTLKVHMIVHSNEKPYKCLQCGRCFKRLAYLVNHIKTHSAIQQCVCTICGQVSNGQEALEDHMRIHTGEIPVEQNLHLDPWYENTVEEPQGIQVLPTMFAFIDKTSETALFKLFSIFSLFS
uniref:C2H2-type domain-containing protein n=1 Tax=Xiphophorus couchianus TaxID=32473 RepID=A0A3B5M226_9TELE